MPKIIKMYMEGAGRYDPKVYVRTHGRNKSFWNNGRKLVRISLGISNVTESLVLRNGMEHLNNTMDLEIYETQETELSHIGVEGAHAF